MSRRLATLVGSGLLLGLSLPARSAENLAVRARSGVREVLSQPEFQPLADADRLGIDLGLDIDPSWREAFLRVLVDLAEAFGKPFADLLSKLLRWALRGLGRLFGGGGTGVPGTGVAPFVLWALVAAALVVLVFLVVQMVRAGRAQRRSAALALDVSASAVADDDALARTPEDWRRRAQHLAASGRRVEAVRALYLELLAALHRVGAIDYDRTRTNTAYVGDVSRGHPARAPFVALTLRFDLAVYGAHEPTADDVEDAAREVDAIRTAFVREAGDA